MEPDSNQPETIPEPEAITKTRDIIARLTEMVNAGDVEAISVYVEGRDGAYRNMQSASVSRHEDVGRILELALLRLGFVQREVVEEIVDERS